MWDDGVDGPPRAEGTCHAWANVSLPRSFQRPMKISPTPFGSCKRNTPKDGQDTFLPRFHCLATFVSAANFTIRDSRLKSVSNSELVYLLDTVNAPVGDAILSAFYPKNHTVMQPTFTAPCEPMYSGVNPDFQPVTA